MATIKTLEEIRGLLKENIGNRVQFKTNKGRKSVKIREGILQNTYPSLFVLGVKTGKRMRKVTFCYTDILTERVIITVLENNTRIMIS